MPTVNIQVTTKEFDNANIYDATNYASGDGLYFVDNSNGPAITCVVNGAAYAMSLCIDAADKLRQLISDGHGPVLEAVSCSTVNEDLLLKAIAVTNKPELAFGI